MADESELAKKVEATARGLWAALTTVRPQVEGEEDYEYLADLGATAESKRAATSMERERTASQNVLNNT